MLIRKNYIKIPIAVKLKLLQAVFKINAGRFYFRPGSQLYFDVHHNSTLMYI